MSAAAFEGPAGVGKTFALFDQLGIECQARTFADHQRVLALTYMQGSRRRLDAMMRAKCPKGVRYDAMTIDSLAWRVCRRWRGLLNVQGSLLPKEGQYDETCRVAATLLEDPHVRSWLCACYPVVIVDEAQDLSVDRVAMLRGIERGGSVLVAFDEFQCLDPKVRPIAVERWLAEVCTPRSLTLPRRTSSRGLLAAAIAIRSGTSLPPHDADFSIREAPVRSGHPPTYAATLLAAQIRRKSGTLAVLTPTRPSKSSFVRDAVALVQTKALKDGTLGPFPNLRWETTDEEQLADVKAALPDASTFSFEEAKRTLSALKGMQGVSAAMSWADRRRRVAGQQSFTRAELLGQVQRCIAAERRYRRPDARPTLAMTIHQAKNREFHNVVVIWPYQVAGDEEQQRRLLYNAVTRAKRSCLVIVQSKDQLQQPPFAPIGAALT